MKRVSLISVILAAILLSACTAPATTPEPTNTPTQIPADVSYEVIEMDTLHDIKRSLDVRLSKRVSENVLREIALELKSKETQSYERTFISYYLPHMVVGSGAWATTHFNPTLEIRIIGLSIQEEETLKSESTPPNVEVIGIWLDDWTSSRITIYQENGLIYLEQVFSDGSSLKEELIENSSTLGRRFDMKEESIDYFIIDSEGNLQLRDNIGLIYTAKRI